MKRQEKRCSGDRPDWRMSLENQIYGSIIAKRFRRMINWLYSLLINGFFGKLFTAYSKEERCFFDSAVFSAVGKGKKVRRVATDVRTGMAKAFENSRILGALSDFATSLIHRRLKTYGAFLLSLGAYSLVAYIVRVYVFAMSSTDPSVIIACAAFILPALPLMGSKETFADAAVKSRFMSKLLFDWLGIPRDTFAGGRVYPARYSFVTALGLVLGALTYFVHPGLYILGAGALLFVSLVFTYPEIGILGLFALMPLCSFAKHPSIALFCVVILTAAGYYFKIIRGKRVVKLGLLDAAVLAFGILLLLCGAVSAGGLASFVSAVLSFGFLMAYLLTVNLIRTKKWVLRCIGALLVSAGLSAVVGVIQMFTSANQSSWVDDSVFVDLGVRITATFDNPNIYAAYLLLVLPFAAAMLLSKSGEGKRLPLTVGFAVLLVCLVETFSRGAWVGAAFAAILFLMVYSRRSVGYLLAGGLLLPLATPLLPQNVWVRVVSIGTASDSSVTYRISAWRGLGDLLRKHWLGGIGVGESAFSAVYPMFSYAGLEGIKHTHNLYLQLLTETGVAGLVLFLLVMLLFVQNCFEFIYKMRDREQTLVVIAGLAAVLGVLILGLTDYIWYSPRVFLLFWLVIGLVSAHIRIGHHERGRVDLAEENTEYSVNLDLNIDNL